MLVPLDSPRLRVALPFVLALSLAACDDDASRNEAPQVALLAPARSALLREASTTVRARITDAEGLESASLFVGDTAIALDLATRDANGELRTSVALPEGALTLRVEAIDDEGETAEDSLSLVVDRTGPSVEILDPSADAVQASETIALHVRIRDAHGLASARLVHGDVAQPIALGSLDANGEATVQTTGVAGANAITIEATDLAGNVASAVRTVTVDQTVPDVAILAPVAASVLGSGTVAIRVRLADDQGLTAATINVGGVTSALDLGARDAQDELVVTKTFPDGTSTVTVTATDTSGQTASDSVTFTVDATAPEATIVSPASGATADAAIAVKVRVADALALASASLSVNGTSSPIALGDLDASGELTVQVTGIEGSNAIVLTAIDAVGHEATDAITVVVDLSPPTAEILAPLGGAELASAQVTVQVRVADGLALAGATLSVNGASSPIDLGGLDASHEASIAITAIEGTNELVLSATDSVGRTSSDVVSFLVDATAPSLTILAPIAHFSETRRLLRATASDANGIAEAEYVLNGEAAVAIDVEAGSDELVIAEALDAVAGPNSLVVTVRDALGNEASETVDFRYGQTTSGGGAHSGAIRGGALWVWGRYGSGQLGLGGTIGDANSRLSPELVPAFGAPGTTVLSIAFNQNHSLAILSDGTVWMWGANGSGQLGQGNTTQLAVPTQVPGISDAVYGVLGFDHTLLVHADGSVSAWGGNGVGQSGVVGNGTTTDTQPSPVLVDGIPADFVEIIAGSAHSAALTASGHVYVWGRNQYGNLGQGVIGAATDRQPVPQLVPGLEGVIDIANGRDHLLAVRGDGSIVAWGLGASGQIGDGVKVTRPSPVAVLDASDQPFGEGLAVFSNGTTSYALLRSGQIWGWGASGLGNLALGAAPSSAAETQLHPVRSVVYTPGTTPVYFDETFELASFGTGASHVVVETQEGEIYAWGWSFRGSLGVASLASNWATPTPVFVVFP